MYESYWAAAGFRSDEVDHRRRPRMQPRELRQGEADGLAESGRRLDVPLDQLRTEASPSRVPSLKVASRKAPFGRG